MASLTVKHTKPLRSFRLFNQAKAGQGKRCLRNTYHVSGVSSGSSRILSQARSCSSDFVDGECEAQRR